MKFSRLVFMFCAMFCTGLMTSCGGDDDSGGGGGGEDCNWVTEIDTEFQALFNAERAYEDDASADNCRTFEGALNDYIDAAKDLEDCARDAGVFQDYKIALDDAESDLNDLSCP